LCAGYGRKWKAVSHLFQVHNGRGPTQDFQDEMTALWKGFSKTTNKRKAKQEDWLVSKARVSRMMTLKKVAAISVREEGDDDRNQFKEGKDPMSPEMYHSVCKCLLEWGTLE
jgi:hypothetical protein